MAYLGSYNPHTKAATVDKESAQKFLTNGAQPSDSAARLLKNEGVKLPAWVKLEQPKKRAVRHPEKLRRNRPAEIETTAAEKSEAPAKDVQEESEQPTKRAAEEVASGGSADATAEETTTQEKEPSEEKTVPEEPQAEPETADKTTK